MKNDVENGTGVPAPHVSRRKFMLAAAATGSAGLLSAATVFYVVLHEFCSGVLFRLSEA